MKKINVLVVVPNFEKFKHWARFHNIRRSEESNQYCKGCEVFKPITEFSKSKGEIVNRLLLLVGGSHRLYNELGARQRPGNNRLYSEEIKSVFPEAVFEKAADPILDNDCMVINEKLEIIFCENSGNDFGVYSKHDPIRPEVNYFPLLSKAIEFAQEYK